WLKVNHPLYSEVTIDTENIDRNLSELQLQPISENDSEVSSNSNVRSEQKATDKQNEEETEDPLDEFRTPTTETCLQSILPDYPVHLQCKGTLDSAGNEVFNIAPGENKHPVWPELFQIIARTQGLNLTDEQLEALSYNERCPMLNLNPVIVAKHFQF
ncbi:unnamed protein product, partial [Porites lobata]